MKIVKRIILLSALLMSSCAHPHGTTAILIGGGSGAILAPVIIQATQPPGRAPSRELQVLTILGGMAIIVGMVIWASEHEPWKYRYDNQR